MLRTPDSAPGVAEARCRTAQAPLYPPSGSFPHTGPGQRPAARLWRPSVPASASRGDHDFIGTEHILLGLVAEAEGVGATDARAGNDPSWGL